MNPNSQITLKQIDPSRITVDRERLKEIIQKLLVMETTHEVIGTIPGMHHSNSIIKDIITYLEGETNNMVMPNGGINWRGMFYDLWAELKVGDNLYTEMADCHPKLKRGQVWCKICGKTLKIDSAECLKHGWPKCCENTMTIDSPEERKELC